MTKNEELAWAAGFFEADGCLHARDGIRIILSAAQVNLEPLERLQATLGGTISGPHSPARNPLAKQPSWRWKLSGKPAIGALTAMRPWLGTRVLDKWAEAHLARQKHFQSKRKVIT